MRRATVLSLLVAPGLLAGPGCVEFGLSVEDTEVVPEVWVEETFTQTAVPRLDVLWVVDDTGSMAEAQAVLGSEFVGFASALDAVGVEYQAGVVTTDMAAEDAGWLQGDPWIVTPALDDPAAAFAAAVDVGVEGSPPEAGLAAMVAALGEPLRSTVNRGFRRPDAALLVVVVSNAADGSSAVLDGDPVTLAVDLLEAEAAATGRSATFSAVVGPAPSGCNGVAGRAAEGVGYLEVAAATGGTSASICDADLGAVLEALALDAIQWQSRFQLQGHPLQETVVVEVDGVRSSSWVLDEADSPPAVVFDPPPPGGARIVVRYRVPGSGGA